MAAAPAMPADPGELIRSKQYRVLLIFAAIIGVVVSLVSWGFLELIYYLQHGIYKHLPGDLGFSSVPVWWPLPWLALAGLLTAIAITRMPGAGGHVPADGLKPGGAPTRPIDLPGVLLAALASIGLGLVLGPEAPLIAIGMGLGAFAIHQARKDAPDQLLALMGAAGAFAAISSLFGSPVVGAVIIVEATGLGGATLPVILLPGLLAAGIGSLIFIGLDNLTGLGTFSLALPGLPGFGQPTVAEFGWAIVIGLAAAVLGPVILWLSMSVHRYAAKRVMIVLPLAGVAVAVLTIIYTQTTGKPSSDVLFSGQSQIGPLIQHASSYSVGALLLLLVCKTLAYGVSRGSFRGGPIFPALFIGAAGGVAMSHLPGLPLVAGVAMGIGALTAAVMKLPLTSVLLASLLLLSDATKVMPLVIVAVVVAYVAVARIEPRLAGRLPGGEKTDSGAHADTALA